MAHARTPPRASDEARDARIGSTARIRGRIAGEGDLTIEGSVEGDIALRGNLTIAEGGSAASDVEAQEVTISGTLSGNVNASGQVRIGASSHVTGDMRGASVTIDEGAQFAGQLDVEFDLPAELQAPGGRR